MTPSHEPRCVLQLSGIRAGYGGIEVLHGVDLEVQPGSVFALLGPNGAGKSTLMRVAIGLHGPTQGDVTIAGRHVNAADPVQLARRGVCAVPEGRGVFPNLSVRENLWMMTHAGADRDEVEAEAYEWFPALAGRGQQVAGSLSGGEQQMLAVARAIVTHPSLLFLDELSCGLAPRVVGQLYDAITRLAATGVAVVVIEQLSRTALRVADEAAVLIAGTIVHRGSPAQITDVLPTAYLGSGSDTVPTPTQ